MAQRLVVEDEVIVVAGKYRGRKGKVLRIVGERVWVDGVAVALRHTKPGQDPANPSGGRIKKTMSIHISNVMPCDPKTGKATRVRFALSETGKKNRMSIAGNLIENQKAS